MKTLLLFIFPPLVFIKRLQFKDSYYFIFHSLQLSLHRKCITNLIIYKSGWSSVTLDFFKEEGTMQERINTVSTIQYMWLHLSFMWGSISVIWEGGRSIWFKRVGSQQKTVSKRTVDPNSSNSKKENS